MAGNKPGERSKDNDGPPGMNGNGKPKQDGLNSSTDGGNGDGGNGPPNGNGSTSALMAPPQPVTPTRTRAFTPQEKSHAQELLAIKTKRYEQPNALYGLRQNVLDYNQPLFFRFWIPAMERDPVLWYGFQMLRSPVITKAKWTVKSDDPIVAAFVDKQLKRFWQYGLPLTLTSLEWGYCGVETIYKYNKRTGLIEFDKWKFLHPIDTRPVLRDGCLIGMDVKRVKERDGTSGETYVGIPKMLWCVHDRKKHRWFGRSRYEGAFIPWYECWQPKGYRNIRHLWLYKNSFDSGTIRYPEGSSVQDPITGAERPAVLVAEEMLDRKEAGAGLALPSPMSEFGGWDYERPESNNVPEGLFTYGDDLRDEKWEGIGVPPEVAKNEGTGSFAGRRVPQQAFYSAEQEIANEQMMDVDEQNLRGLTRLNFGHDEYELEPIPILLTLQQEEMGVVTGHLPGDGTEGDPQGGGTESQLSNGRIEDRGSNSFNQSEQGIAANS